MDGLSPALAALHSRRAKIAASIELELQFEKKAVIRPLKIVLAKARVQALAALDQLIYADAEDPYRIRNLQNEVRRYDDLVNWMREIIIEGKDADRELDEMETDELAVVMNTAEGREIAAQNGIDDEGSDR